MLLDVYIPLRPYGRIRDRILTVLDECDGQFDGIVDLALICNSTPRRVNRELIRMQHQRILRIERGSGRGNKTRIKRA